MNARKLIMVGLLLLLAGACIFMLLPLESYWPGALPYVELSGRLDGRPVEVSLDRTSTDSPMVEVQIKFSMRSGTFRAAYPEMGPRSYLVGGQEGDHQMRLPRDKKLLLDPMGGSGTYQLTIGSPFHPFSRPARRLLALSILGGLLLGLAYRLAAKRSPSPTPAEPSCPPSWPGSCWEPGSPSAAASTPTCRFCWRCRR